MLSLVCDFSVAVFAAVSVAATVCSWLDGRGDDLMVLTQSAALIWPRAGTGAHEALTQPERRARH